MPYGSVMEKNDDPSGALPGSERGASFGGLIEAAVAAQSEALKTALSAAADGQEPERVHDARTAARRLLAYLGLLRGGKNADPGRSAAGRLRKLAGRLGETRDLDVLAADAEEYAERLGEKRRAGFGAYQEALRERRRNALGKLRGRVHAGYVEETLALVGDAVRTGLERKRARRPAGIDAPAALLAAYSRLLARADDAFSGVPAEKSCHSVRRAAKRLRYVLEVFEPALGPRGAACAAELKALQDYLGKLNDAATAAACAASWVSSRESAAPSIPEAARYLGARRRRMDRGLAGFRTAWGKVASAAFRKRFFSLLEDCSSVGADE